MGVKVNNRTAIFISHRMSSTKSADRIVVMKDGKIVETGTYSELMINDREFKKLYDIKANHYSSTLQVN
ncbi:hypothetical protein ACQKMY_21005 [Peribacillus frigoritolerans]|uniref:hypothetical protein n=1 Tax=Peribacillus frigoritolerans TaxID=450367 RepID=UPI003D07C9B8